MTGRKPGCSNVPETIKPTKMSPTGNYAGQWTGRQEQITLSLQTDSVHDSRKTEAKEEAVV
jgi:hypothetical protein